MEAEDAAQECFEALACAGTKPGQYVGAWLHRVAINRCRSRLRAETHRKAREQKYAAAMDVGREIAWDDLYAYVDEAITELPEKYRQPVVAHFLEGQTHAAVAESLGVSRQTATYRIEKGIEHVRKALKRHGIPVLAVTLAELLRANGAEAAPARLTATLGKLALAGPPASTAAMAVPAYSMLAKSIGRIAVVLVLAIISAFAVQHLRTSGRSAGDLDADGSTVALLEKAAEAVPAPPLSPEPVAPPPPDFGDETGPGHIECLLADPLNRPIPDAKVCLERITWGPGEFPPAQTFRRSVTSDAGGRFSFEHLPCGDYCVIAYTMLLGGVNDFHVRKTKTIGSRHIWMRPLGAFSGVVRTSAGDPVAGAVLYPVAHLFVPDDEFDHSQVASARAISAEDGTFRFRFMYPGGMRFFVLAPNRPPVITEFVPIASPGEIVLKTPGSLSGRVVDANTDAPKPNVRLRIHQGKQIYTVSAEVASDAYYGKNSRGWRVSREVTCGEDGAFQVADLAPGSYHIAVEDAALINTEAEAVVIDEGKETADFAVKVSTGGTIKGRISYQGSSTGAEGMKVLAVSGNASQESLPAGSTGDYVLTCVRPGSYRLEVMPAEQEVWPCCLEGIAKSEVTIQWGQVLDHVDFVLPPQLEIEGRVLDKQGMPVAEASVTAADAIRSSSAISDAEGYFRLIALSETGRVFVDAQKEGLRSARVALQQSGGDLTLRLDILAESTIQGVVQDATGTPMLKVKVVGESVDSGEQDGRTFTASTDLLGGFNLNRLPAGRYRIVLHAPEVAAPVDAGVFAVAERENVKDLRLTFGETGTLSISGRILDTDGCAFIMASITCKGISEHVADLMGNFEIKGLTEGAYDLQIGSPRHSAVVLKGVPAGTRGLTAKLQPVASLSGVVVDAVSRQPVAEFLASYRAEDPVVSDGVPDPQGEQACKNPEGQFRFASVSATPTVLKVSATGYVPWVRNLDGLIAGQDNAFTVELTSAARVEGGVRDASGKPIPGAKIFAGPEVPSEATPLVRSGEDGSFVLDSLEAGVPHTLVVTHGGYAPESVEVVSGKGQTARCDVVLQKTGRLVVRAFLDGHPANSFTVIVEGPGHAVPALPAASNADGVFVADALAPGEVAVTVSIPETPPRRQTVQAEIAPGETTEFEVTFDQ